MSTPLHRLAMAVTAALVGGTLGAAGLAGPAHAHHEPNHVAATMIVNVLHDGVDATPGDGVCDTGADLPSGEAECTLRAAVQELNAFFAAHFDPNPDSGQWFQLFVMLLEGTSDAPAVHELTLTGAGEDASATGDLDITSNVYLYSSAPDVSVVSGSGLGDRVLDVHGLGSYLHLPNVTITEGAAPSGEDGGGIRMRDGGGLDLSSARVVGNSARDGGGVASSPAGTLSVYDSQIEGNIAERDGGGVWIDYVDTADWGYGQPTLDGAEVTGNHAGRDGGGIWLRSRGEYHHGTPELGGVISGNTADGDGGGIRAEHATPDGFLEIDGDIVQNTASGAGGGAWVLVTGADSTISITADIEDNGAIGDGGGAWVGGTESAVDSVVEIDDTVARNHAGREDDGEDNALNDAANGGGVWIGPVEDAPYGPTLLAESAQFVENVAVDRYDDDLGEDVGGHGGGIWLGPSATDHVLRTVTVAGNRARGDGGGIAHVADGVGGLNVGWSTLAANTASGNGGGLWTDAARAGLTNATVSGNLADEGGGVFAPTAALTLVHSTVTANAARDWATGILGGGTARASFIAGGGSDDEFWGDDCGSFEWNEATEDAAWTSLGYNVVGEWCLLEPQDGDMVLAEGEALVGLTALADHGGYTSWPGDLDDYLDPDDAESADILVDRNGLFAWERSNLAHPHTHAPADAESVFVDAVPAGECPQTDQRQVPRPVGVGCDIGAVEYVEQLADLNIGGGWTEAPVGEPAEIPVWVGNEGPDDFDTATFTVGIPVEASYVSSNGDCAHDAGIVTCTVTGDVPDVMLTVTTPAETGSSYLFPMELISWTTHDPNPHNTEGSGRLLAYIPSVPDPDPGFENDEDGDGVHDAIDSDPLPPAEDPSGPGGFTHGATGGHINVRAGHRVFVQPDPGMPAAEDGRVLISVTSTEDSTVDRAVVGVCGGFALRMLPQFGAIVRCGSLYTEIVEGAVDVELPDGTIVAVPEGVTAFIQDNEDGSFTIEHQGGLGVITVRYIDGTTDDIAEEGKLELPAPPGPNPDPPVDPCKKDKSKSDKSKSKSDKGKNKSECKDPKPTPSPKPTKTEKPKDPKPKPTKTEKPKDPKPKPTKTEKPKADSKSKDTKSKDTKSKNDSKSKDKNGNSYGKNQSRPC